MILLPQLASVRIGLSARCACALSASRADLSRNSFIFSSREASMGPSHSGMASRTKPLANESRTPKLIGIVNATTLPPFLAA
jgi:hypothetical protein